ncbi:MAG: DEAD/DEAH box helicase, partial [Defluviitaleaceae bacterium]|nr:DEAD/DEAH box helicase [Defluviitaleaceae bacterium]
MKNAKNKGTTKNTKNTKNTENVETLAFDRYAPFIQEYIYRKQWADLREVQVEACTAILDTDDHVIIASATASGKTEAALFPILTLLDENPPNSIGIIYIGPLKALINDQFERLNGLLQESDIPVWAWHGDISQTAKNKAIKTARGILQITPESLEALLMRKTGEVQRLFSDLRFIVIDELHAMMGMDRGLQVICQINRIERLTGNKPRRIGLSATLNDYLPAEEFLAAGGDRKTQTVGIKSHKKTISLAVENFILPEDELRHSSVLERYNQFIYDYCKEKKCIIFTNSRSDSEKIIVDMKKLAAANNEEDIFHVHHGSISAALRHDAELALRENAEPTVAAATLTLELGIDIGDLDSTVQLGAPYTAASFVQRLG